MNITGTIIDETGVGLPGANVYMSDSNGNTVSPPKGIQTDINGKYSLEGLPEYFNKYVSVSFIGYKTVTKKLSDLDKAVSNTLNVSYVNGSAMNLPLNVQMQKETNEIPEFTVIAKAKNNKWLIYAGIGLVVLIASYFIYKKMR